MSTFNADAARLSDEELAAIDIPEFPRQFVKVQPKGERKFTASGAKADAILRYVLHGGYSRDQIAFFTGASPSRVGECVWAMEAADVAFPALARKTASKPAPAPAAAQIDADILADAADDEQPVVAKVSSRRKG